MLHRTAHDIQVPASEHCQRTCNLSARETKARGSLASQKEKGGSTEMCGALGGFPTHFPVQRFYQEGWGRGSGVRVGSLETQERSLRLHCTYSPQQSSGFAHARDVKLGTLVALERSMNSMVYLITQDNPPNPLFLF